MRARGKYGAVPTVVDAIRFASKAEAHRYQQLKLLERGGRIRGLLIHPRYKLWSGDPMGRRMGQPVCAYEADFEYEERVIEGVWRTITEDVKGGPLLPLFKLKAKWFQACYDREVRIVRADGTVSTAAASRKTAH